MSILFDGMMTILPKILFETKKKAKTRQINPTEHTL